MTDKLLPCPFCGGSPKLRNGGPGNHYISCYDCEATSDDGSEERAVSLWNRRAPQPESPQDRAVVTDEMVVAARKAYSTATGCDDTPHVLDGWIDGALRAVLEAALAAEGRADV